MQDNQSKIDHKDCTINNHNATDAVVTMDEDFVSESQAQLAMTESEMRRQQEEIHLLSLQNEQYRQTLEGQRMLVTELYKALKQSNETARKIKTRQVFLGDNDTFARKQKTSKDAGSSLQTMH